jgi:ankyrin repeat protein
MSARTLPPSPSLAQLKKQAKTLLKAHRARSVEAVSRLRASVPKLAHASDAEIENTSFALHDAQFAIAREYGFDHWQALEAHVVGSGEIPVGIPDGMTAYFEAVRANDVERVREILEAEPALVHQRIADLFAEVWAPADPGDRQSNTALHWAAVKGWRNAALAPLAQILIDYGADVDAMGYNGNKGVAPTVVLAAWEGDLDVLRVLLDNGADPNRPASAESALYCAIEHTDPDASEPNKVSLLLEHGAEHDVFTAAMTGRTDLVEELLDEYDPLIERRSLKRDRTPLEEAVQYGRWETAERLVDRGAVVSIQAAAALGRTDPHDRDAGWRPGPARSAGRHPGNAPAHGRSTRTSRCDRAAAEARRRSQHGESLEHQRPAGGAEHRESAGGRAGEVDVGKALGDMRIPDSMGTPRPSARIPGGRGFLVLIESRKVDSPDVPALGGQRPAIGLGQPLRSLPRKNHFDAPAAIAVAVVVQGAVDVDCGLQPGKAPVTSAKPCPARMGLEADPVDSFDARVGSPEVGDLGETAIVVGLFPDQE